MRAQDAIVRLDRRRRDVRAEIEECEATAAQVGDQLAEVRQRKAKLALEEAALDRALEALERDPEPVEAV